MKLIKLTVSLILYLSLISCNNTETIITSQFNLENFGKVTPEMTTGEVLSLLGEPFSRNHVREWDNNISVYPINKTPNESRMNPLRIWRYSKPVTSNEKFKIYQVVVDTDRDRVVSADAYISPINELPLYFK